MKVSGLGFKLQSVEFRLQDLKDVIPLTSTATSPPLDSFARRDELCKVTPAILHGEGLFSQR